MNKRELKKFRETYKPWKVGEFITESVRLAVHFDEKEWVKGHGAKWNPDPSGKGGFWTISLHKLGGLCLPGTYSVVDIFQDLDDDSAGDQTVMDWLNANRMIEGLHGDFLPQMATAYEDNHVADERHTLSRHPDEAIGGGEVNFDVYDIHGTTVVRQWHPGGQGHLGLPSVENWYYAERGREAWDHLIDAGYLPKKEEVAA